jgi:hypothetical protein
MINYAEITNETVSNIIVSTEASILSIPGQFVKISDALNPEFCSVGSLYNKEKNAFARQKPYESWTLNENTFIWEPPVAKPSEGIHAWDEENVCWIEITPIEIEIPSPTE